MTSKTLLPNSDEEQANRSKTCSEEGARPETCAAGDCEQDALMMH